MEGNANYEEVKETTKTLLQLFTSDDLHYALFLLLTLIILLKLIDLIFLPFKKRGNMIGMLLKGCLKAFLIFTIGMRIFSLIPGMQDFTNQIVLSSSLIVVVLGFVFQEGLTNIVHGFIITVFRPFHIGDRVSVTVDGETITGYIREITARHTVLQNVLNSAHVVIPNSKMDTCIVVNSYFNKSTMSTSFMDICITYESNIDHAMMILSETIQNHPFVQEAREARGTTDPVGVMVRELASSYIGLRAEVLTMTVEQNFKACSDIRLALVHAIKTTSDVSFAYPHIQVVSSSAEKDLVIGDGRSKG